MNIGRESLPEFRAGSGSVGTNPQPLGNGDVVKHVVIRAASENTGTVIVGPVGKSSSGFVLNSGEQTPPIYIDNLSSIEVVGSDTDQDYSWVAS